MRSSPIMTFMQASSCRVSASGTWVMVAVTPESTSRSMASSSFSHCRMSFKRDIDPVAIPSAAMAAASRANSQASTVRRTSTECDGSGEDVFTLAVLIDKTALPHFDAGSTLRRTRPGSTQSVAHTPMKSIIARALVQVTTR